MKHFWVAWITSVFFALAPAAALAHEEGAELAEPLFTEKAFLESEVEFEVGFDNKDTESETEIGLGGSWVFFDRLQVGVDIPIGIRDPDVGKSEHSAGDVEFSGKYLLFQAPENRLFFTALAEVAAPTGDGDKEIGGQGEWGLFLLAGAAVPLPDLPDLGVHLQFGWGQQIRITDPQRAEAAELGLVAVREKEVIWRMAFNMQLYDGMLAPSIEILGTTIVDAIEAAEQGTIIELGGGFWLAPFGEGDALGPLKFGFGAKGPVTNNRESNQSFLFILKYELAK